MCGEGWYNFGCSAVCAYLLPPLGIFWRFGCGCEFWICLLLTMCGYLPGVIYAVCMLGFDVPKPGDEHFEARTNFCLSAVCAYIVPPLGVFWRFGVGVEFGICLLLTFCGYIPGIIYAACIIGCEDTHGRDAEVLLGGGHRSF
mmetsp:Transcript_73024/g.237454  ORF Transcript_73024/g.237454 Transcript_73024/m.237454 type:complete len:143 (+) Transcript_73024:88-516(+)